MTRDVTFTPSEGDYIAANLAWQARAPHRRWLFWLTLALGVLTTGSILLSLARGLSLMDAVSDSAIMLAALLIFLAHGPVNRLLIPRQVRKMLAQNKALLSPVQCQWSNEAITFSGKSGNSTIDWKDLHRWFSDESSFVFLLSDRLMLLLPTRALSGAQQEDLHMTAVRFGPEPR
ncbi:MAG: YcxB family protein [Candidatus Sphingomonas phytovorans]|nr:YcxB family protein [Sphingomonas sp.]WEJ98920.1 MAG: YcxB family protein [Sphingomonas sp.]